MVLRLSAKAFAIFAIKREETSESQNLKTSYLPNKISRIKELRHPLPKTGAPLTSNSGSASTLDIVNCYAVVDSRGDAPPPIFKLKLNHTHSGKESVQLRVSVINVLET